MIIQLTRIRRHKYRQPHVAHTGDTKTLVPSDYCTLIQNSNLTNEKWAWQAGFAKEVDNEI